MAAGVLPATVSRVRKYSRPCVSLTFSRRMASNLHLVVQMPQPMHWSSLRTTAPQPSQRSVSFFICSSVNTPRRSWKVFFASSAEPSCACWRGVLSKLSIGTATVAGSSDL